MTRAAIVAPVRTAVGRFGGALRPVPAEDWPRRSSAPSWTGRASTPRAIEDVVMAQSYANSEAPCIGRWAALHADLPIAVPGHADRPALRRRAAGGGHRRHDGADRRGRRRSWPAGSNR